MDYSVRVGDPATAMTARLDERLDYCERSRLPADFISTHIYPTDPLGIPYDNRTVRVDVDLPPQAVTAVRLKLAPEPSATGAAA